MGTLFVVGTPIGNLKDISNRALEILRSVDAIACEDTRRTIKLLNHFGIQKTLTSYHDFNEEQRAEEMAARIAAGASIALVSDAGMPAISDPGYRVVRLCRSRGLPVVVVPGPNAAIAAIAGSGLPSNEFMFLGFLPAKREARRTKLRSVANLECTLAFYEAPHRIQDSLEDVQEALGDREICIARELTKLHEEFLCGNISEVRARVNPIGEFVVVVHGAVEAPQPAPVTRDEVLKRLGMTRNQLYELFFKRSE